MSLLLFGSDPRINYNFSSSLPSGTIFTRASMASYFDSSQNLTSAAINDPRFNYDVITGGLLGLLYEEQRTNLVRNSTMQGAANPSTPPTNWTLTTSAGLTRTIVGTGVENGMTYVEIRLAGTTTGTQWLGYFDTGLGASVGNTLTNSFYIKTVVNDTDVTGCRAISYEYQSTTKLLEHNGPLEPLSTSLSRIVYTVPFTNASVDTAWCGFRFQFPSTGLAVDFTFRIYAPQVEIASTVSSFIPTTTTVVTRAVDQLSFTIPTGMSNLTYFFDDGSKQTVTVTAGAYTVPTNLNRPNIKRIVGV